MKTLHAYLNSLPKSERSDFIRRCGTSEGYLRKAISTGQSLGESLCINLERESCAAVRCEELRPDVDWDYLRNSNPATQPTQEVTHG
ncbi:YdaS family helix-turn-helix protein [Comamonas antarctica]|uniref:transcriptional regulator n=1 Tax=Comamonas antarctica TaxID=2743470 RepID=UPI0028E8FCAA|nr:YdaS family helix-turn-helix protein [Comamonas antarctica]